MALSRTEREKIEAVHLCGPRTADFLEMVGIETFDALADADAEKLRLAVNAVLGRPLINAMGERAFQNAIDAARSARADMSGTGAGRSGLLSWVDKDLGD